MGEARPIVQIHAGKRAEAIRVAEAHLIDRDLEIFQRGGFVVRIAPQEIKVAGGNKASALRIVPIGTEHMRDRFNLAVDLHRFDKRAKEWVSTDCPTAFANSYLEMNGLWRLPALHAVSTIPVLRRDGSIIERPGFDRASGVYYDPGDIEFPAVPASPDKADAIAALERFEELLSTFDFIDSTSQAVAISALLTPMFRQAMCASPIHGVTAPLPGSGKTKIVNIAAILATGHPPPLIALGHRDEESEKRLSAAVIAGDLVVSIDNAERPVGGEFLCQIITEPLVAPRLLSTMSLVRSPNVVAWYATGNNLKFLGDMTRRALICGLDPKCERPELREFETPDPCEIVAAERPVLVVAALTIARAFLLNGCPRAAAPLASFVDWCRWVRDPLMWLGRADPVEAINETRRADPRLTTLTAVIERWAEVIGDRRVTAREVAETGNQQGITGFSHPDLREALLAVAGEAGQVSGRRLGRWLADVKDRQVNGKYFIQAGIMTGTQRWQLIVARH